MADARTLLNQFRQGGAKGLLEHFRNPAMLKAVGTLQRDASGQVVGNTFAEVPPPPEPTTGGQAFKRGILESIAGNIANTPRLLLAGSGLLGNDAEMPVEVPRILPEVDVPHVGGQEALAGILGGARSAGNVLQGQPPNLQQNVQSSLDQGQRLQSEHPVMSWLGGATGDALSILLGRSPFTRIGPVRTSQATTDILAPKLEPLLQKGLRPEAAKNIAKIAGRSLEGGIEAATLAMLQEGDPIQSAAYAGASQMAGLAGLKIGEVSGFGDLLQGKIIKGGAKLGATAFAVGSVIQFLKSASPGGKDFILQSIEAGYDKIPLSLTLGALSAMSGAGRLRGGGIPIAKAEMPGVLMDAMSTLPRGVTISLINDALADESVERTLTTLTTDPNSFSEAQIKQLSRALEDGKFSDAVREMLERDERFRSVITAPHPRLAGVPLRDAE